MDELWADDRVRRYRTVWGHVRAAARTAYPLFAALEPGEMARTLVAQDEDAALDVQELLALVDWYANVEAATYREQERQLTLLPEQPRPWQPAPLTEPFRIETGQLSLRRRRAARRRRPLPMKRR